MGTNRDMFYELVDYLRNEGLKRDKFLNGLFEKYHQKDGPDRDEIETLAILRYEEPRLEDVHDNILIDLYSRWCEEEHAAGWVDITRKEDVDNFIKWAFAPKFKLYYSRTGA